MNHINRAIQQFVHQLGNWTVMEHALYAIAGLAVVYIFVIVARDGSRA